MTQDNKPSAQDARDEQWVTVRILTHGDAENTAIEAVHHALQFVFDKKPGLITAWSDAAPVEAAVAGQDEPVVMGTMECPYCGDNFPHAHSTLPTRRWWQEERIPFESAVLGTQCDIGTMQERAADIAQIKAQMGKKRPSGDCYEYEDRAVQKLWLLWCEAKDARPPVLALTDERMWAIAKDEAGTVLYDTRKPAILDVATPKELGDVVRAIIKATE